jgi:pimeloyl-ACP methyl ester carboxylesterase
MKHKKVLSVIGAAAASISGVVLSINVFNKMVFKNAVKKDSSYEKGQYYEWEYGNVHYKVYGNGEPVLLLHSLSIGSSHREWMENISDLSKRYKIYAVDLPGYGYSDKPKMTYTAFTYASFVKDFIDNVIKKDTAVIAANGSAMFAVIAAKLFPEKINNMILISPGGIVDKMAENSDFKRRTFMELPLKGTFIYNLKTSKKAIRHYISEYGFYAKEKVRDDIVDAFYFAAHSEKGNARYAYASYVTNYMNMDIKNYLKEIKVPLTIVWGEENDMFNSSAAEIVKELVPWAKFYVFEKTKALPHMENPKEFYKVVSINIKQAEN